MHQNLAVKEKASLKGVYIFTKAILEKPEHFDLDRRITEARAKLWEMEEELASIALTPSYRLLLTKRATAQSTLVISMIRELNTICRTEKTVVENIVPTVGRTMIANNLTDTTPDNVPYVKYAEVGTGTNAPANSDTTLQTSTYRNAIASRTNASNVGYVTAFYNATETSGTFREAGIFCDGTASAGTGILLSRVAINVTKTTSNTLTIDWTLTIS